MIAQLVSPISYLREDANQHLSPEAIHAINDRASKLFDLVKYRIEKGIDPKEIAEDLKEEVFELRMAVLSNYANSVSILQKIIAKELDERTLVRVDDKEINQVYREVLGLYGQIIGSSSTNQGISADAVFPSISYSLYKEFFKQLPQPLAERVYLLLDHSLTFELSLVLISMVLDKQVKLKTKATKQLIKMAKKSIEHIGFYSALLDVWHPAEEDESPIVRNIKIRLAIEELGGARNPRSFKDVSSLFTA